MNTWSYRCDKCSAELDLVYAATNRYHLNCGGCVVEVTK